MNCCYREIQLTLYTHPLVTAVEHTVKVSCLDIFSLIMIIEGNAFSVLLLRVLLVVNILQMQHVLIYNGSINE